MIVKNDLLSINKYIIYQDTNSFNFSIDSILLGYFVNIKKQDKVIVDLCSGNAPVCMYLTLKTNAKIYGVEILKKSYELGLRSIIENKLDNQIRLINDNLIGINKKINESVDVVTCNPPFYKKGHFNQTLNYDLLVAKHEELVTFEEIVIEVKKLLQTKKVFAFVHRPNRLDEIIVILNKHNFYIKRLCFVHPKINQEANHVLIEATYNTSSFIKVLKPIIVYNEDNTYTDLILDIFSGKVYDCK